MRGNNAQGVGDLGFPELRTAAWPNLPPEWFGEWLKHRTLEHPGARRVIDTTTTRMAAMMAQLIAHGLPSEAMILNINFPGAVNGDTPVRWVPAQFNRYGTVFRPDGDGFVHASKIELHEENDGVSDRSVLQAGGISVTPLSLKGLTVANIREFPL